MSSIRNWVLALTAQLGSATIGAAQTPPEATNTQEPQQSVGERIDEDLRFLEQTMVEEVLVTVASRSAQTVAESPSVVSVLTQQELRSLGLRTVAEALNVLPGMTARYTKSGQYDVLANGQREAPDVLVMLDGERLNSSQDGAVLYDLDLGNVQRIEVIRGPGSALYGTNAFAAVINIITHSSAEDGVLSLSPQLLPSTHPDVDARGAMRGHVRQGTQLGNWKLGAYASGWWTPGAGMAMPLDRTGTFDGELRLLNDRRSQGTAGVFARSEALLFSGDSLEFRPKYIFQEQGPNFGVGETFAPNSTLRRDMLLVPLDDLVKLSDVFTLSTRASFDRQNVSEDIQIRPDGYSDRANPIAAPEGFRKRTQYAVNTFVLEPQLLAQLPEFFLWEQHHVVFGVQGSAHGRQARGTRSPCRPCCVTSGRPGTTCAPSSKV